MTEVVVATLADMPAWLDLAREVEPLFGPMSENPEFHRALQKNIDRSTAFCIREAGGAAGVRLLGGLLFSPHPPVYSIGWLAVTRSSRRQGIGQSLMEYAMSLVKPPAEIILTTFGEDNPEGQAARHFYVRLGFRPAELVPNAADGGTRQVFRRTIS